MEDAPRRLTPPLFSRPPHFVGRDAELAVLSQWWTQVQRGMRQVGFIVGEPGIGKTALVDTFVAQLAATQDIPVGRGQCVNHYGMGEPYLPVLEALGRLCRDAEGDRFVSCLRRCAPSWLPHLPAVLAPADREALLHATHGVTPSRMLRELTDALEVLTAARPLVLVLEDLHWSDRATLAWLAYMARRRDSAQVLILGTYRPGEMVGHAHPLRPLLAGSPEPPVFELVLDALSAPAVASYVNPRCTAATLPASLPQFIHRRTSGLPLFLVALVDELVRSQLLESGEKERERRTDLEARGEVVPDNLRQYIEQHLERLPDEDQALLEAASIAGPTFAVAAVAAGVARAAEALEARFTVLARQGQFVRASGTQTWPDGTMTACYQFKHALYHEVVCARMSAGHSMHLHQRIGPARRPATALRRGRSLQSWHCTLRRTRCRAGRALSPFAAENALRRSAYQEAIAHLTQGLEMLTSLPDAAERVQHELEFLATLGLALVATRASARGRGRTYAHARALCRGSGRPRSCSGVAGSVVVSCRAGAAIGSLGCESTTHGSGRTSARHQSAHGRPQRTRRDVAVPGGTGPRAHSSGTRNRSLRSATTPRAERARRISR
jgi:predicted ATPase